jgi:glycosyltransferase involved in cell wall biosynthesis
VTLSVIGSGTDLSALLAEAQPLTSSGVVEFIAPMNQAELAACLCRHDAGVVPLPDEECWNTSSPLKLMEYLSCGMPVVLTRIPAHTAVLDDSSIAVWASDASARELAHAIMECSRRIDELSRLAAWKGRDLAMLHTWEREAQRFHAYLSGLRD